MGKKLIGIISSTFISISTYTHGSTIITGYTAINSDTYEFSGSGFNLVTSVSYFGRNWVDPTDANFSIISDSLISVSTEGGAAFGTQTVDLLIFETSNSMTVVFSQPWNIISATVNTGGSRLDVIENGGFDTGIGGSSAVYIESGGQGAINGAGGNLVFVENGASFTGFGGGGSNDVFYESGASINTPNSGGGSNVTTEFSEISFQSVQPGITSTVPEPSSVLILGLGSLGLVARRRRIV